MFRNRRALLLTLVLLVRFGGGAQFAASVGQSVADGGATARSAGPLCYDSRLRVTWLADANLPATQTFGVQGVHKSGSMNYATALRWVAAMNESGYLGHHNWQLPTAPDEDPTCARTGRHGESFGFGCSESVLGSLYYKTLGLRAPNTAVPLPSTNTGPFRNFQPYLYWSLSAAADPKQGFISFSFNTGFQGANAGPNHLYVLPLIKGPLPGTTPASGEGLRASADGKTIYDPRSQVTWLADANLAETQSFGVPNITRDGAMDHDTALRWIDAMNKADRGRGYLGQTHWQLPETGRADPSCSLRGTTGYDCTGSAMGALYYQQLGLHRGDPVVATPDVTVGPFHHLQPYLYWACSGASALSPCRADGPAAGFEWNFSFGNGFQGTNLTRNDLYVMVYFPGAASGPPAK